MNESKATRYQRMRRRAQAAAQVLALATLSLFAFTPLGRWSHDLTSGLLSAISPAVRDPAALLLYIAVVVLSCEVAALPAELYRSRWIDPSYGRPDGGTIRARLVMAFLLLPVTLLAGGVIALATRSAGPGWWLAAGTLLSLGLVGAMRLGPLVLGASGVVGPLDRPALARRIAGLASRAGVPVAAIQEWRTGQDSSAVAMVTGVGRGRRVLLTTDVARHWSDDEVTVVVAHELAHHVHHDLLRSALLNAVLVCGGLLAGHLVLAAVGPTLGLGGPADPVALPLIAFMTLAVWLLTTPLRHAQSRRQERHADHFALAVTGHADAFATALRRASAQQLAEEHPSVLTRWLYHRHPPVSERLALARDYMKEGPRAS